MKAILCGNEVVAQGALEAGARLATSYPGSPASEIMNYLIGKKSKDFYAEWSSNEKVALEICLGASTVNQRSLCSMKANGLNLCIDTLMSLTKKGIKGGLVVVVVDDPDVRYSDVVQDSKRFMEVIGFPILEPKTIQDCLEMPKKAFELSEKIARPVFISLNNKLGHLYAPVRINKRVYPKKPKFDKNSYKFNPYSKEKEKTIPYFCPGCPHEAFYSSFNPPESYIINGDIGCYEIAGFGNNKDDKKPIREMIDTLFVMGSGINVSQGQFICGQKSIALCGDGTFWHSGINGLINAVYNKHNIVFIIMDNLCVAMTGQQSVPNISIEKVCQDMGCHVEVVNPYEKEQVSKAIKNAIDNTNRINVIISRASCVLKLSRSK
jgi:TPP-dependent indolepyruvate ferredoxin oxidoreductase alpha subunit